MVEQQRPAGSRGHLRALRLPRVVGRRRRRLAAKADQVVHRGVELELEQRDALPERLHDLVELLRQLVFRHRVGIPQRRSEVEPCEGGDL